MGYVVSRNGLCYSLRLSPTYQVLRGLLFSGSLHLSRSYMGYFSTALYILSGPTCAALSSLSGPTWDTFQRLCTAYQVLRGQLFNGYVHLIRSHVYCFAAAPYSLSSPTYYVGYFSTLLRGLLSTSYQILAWLLEDPCHYACLTKPSFKIVHSQSKLGMLLLCPTTGLPTHDCESLTLNKTDLLKRTLRLHVRS